MKRILGRGFVAALLIIGSVLGTNASENSYVNGEVIVQLHPGFDIGHILHTIKQSKGSESGFRLKSTISRDMRMYLIQFDNQHCDVHQAIELMNGLRGIAVAQVNHILSNRSTQPNDPLFASQWQYVNNGANGGTVDADIDADDAWDISTGGVTALGDTIVVCVIDDGLDLTHNDFGDNLWLNHAEVPNNGIDDDNNGYIDDYQGWNTDDLNGDISNGTFGGWHGTPVAGIVGARGDNGIGVSGVNWRVKLMIVVGGGNEAEALAAYAYPLTMRKKYNSTNGAEGAFVVSTNASWGIDFGQPASAPLWCAMYDSLGKYGILSCGATINGNQDVDVVGDLPTACPSDYLISVTNMNNQDNKVIGAGYGATTIDLGAHGEGTYTTASGNSYSGFGGTSGATPHVSGAIAMLYSAPCPNLIAFAMSYPDSAARLVKKFILDGTDPNSSLSGITTSGGRLNLYNSMLEVLSYDCSGGDCFPAYSLNASNITDTSATLSWSAIPSAVGFEIDLRTVGAPVWTTYTSVSTALDLSNLTACTDFEFTVTAMCDTSNAVSSDIFTFTTDGCCKVPNGVTETMVTETSAEFSWNSLLAAQSFNARYRAIGSLNWIAINAIAGTAASLSGLDTCTKYEFQVQTVCDTGVTDFSSSTFFETNGCTDCPNLVYCPSGSVNSSDEWIDRIVIDTFDHQSGDDGGYGDHTGLSLVLHLDSTYNFTFQPGFGAFTYNEYWLAWIDYNQDGDFGDAGELIFDADSADDLPKMGQFTIPNDAISGSTRLRISMRYNDPVSSSCMEDFDFGEVEDYCVRISIPDTANNPVGIVAGMQSALKQVSVFPNPTSGNALVSFQLDRAKDIWIHLYNAQGQEISGGRLDALQGGNHDMQLPLKALSSGIYFVRISSGGESILRKIIRQ